MNPTTKITAYSGTVSAMRASPWLASEDLAGLGDVSVVIECVVKIENAVLQDGRTEKLLWGLKFQGKDKSMVLNATNRKTLTLAYGALTKEWPGKQVTLYVQDGVKKPGARGETTTGLRIRIPDAVRRAARAADSFQFAPASTKEATP